MMYPFTSSQWKELEQQALIFKYLASGLPIPSHLIMPIKSSFFHMEHLSIASPAPAPAPAPALAFLPLHSPTPTAYASPEGWGCFQPGFVRRVEDPEPGRCRRTDGKKWRCSREAHGDSKYCERHMHRGKNRSRKLVELSLATANSSTSSTSYSPYSSYRSAQGGSAGIGFSLADDNHHRADSDSVAKKESGKGKWCVDQIGAKGYANGLTIGLTMNPTAIGSDLSKIDSLQRPTSFHSFFN